MIFIASKLRTTRKTVAYATDSRSEEGIEELRIMDGKKV